MPRGVLIETDAWSQATYGDEYPGFEESLEALGFAVTWVTTKDARERIVFDEITDLPLIIKSIEQCLTAVRAIGIRTVELRTTSANEPSATIAIGDGSTWSTARHRIQGNRPLG